MAAPTVGVPSRFALLKLVDDSEDERERKEAKKASKQAPPENSKKKNRKKKTDSDVKNELRTLAFGGTGAAKGHSKTDSNKQTSKTTPCVAQEQTAALQPAPEKQWESWKDHDKEQVDEMFQQELQKAILLSKIETEATRQENTNTENTDPVTKKSRKGKNKSDRPVTTSVTKPVSMYVEDYRSSSVVPAKHHEVYPTLSDNKLPSDDFFDAVSSSAAQIIKQEKLQEEYQKQFKVQAVLQAKHNTVVEVKDHEITELRQKLFTAEEELKEVKKRNKQLCFILAQGEMKEKSEILQQVDTLNQIKEELTNQLSDLSSELEKERSKVHTMQQELSKIKGKSK